jgi:Holliday junction resolvase RusA-like endonuclease
VYKVEIEVSGQPQGKGRPRFTRTGKAYTPDKTREYESRIQAAAWKAMQNMKLDMTERFVSVEIIAFMEIPKSWSKVKRIEAEYGALQHTTKPDLDNIVKAALDGMEGAVYVSDKQVTSIKARKMYCHPDRGAVLYMSVSWTNPGE